MQLPPQIRLTEDSEWLIDDAFALLGLALACPWQTASVNGSENGTTFTVHSDRVDVSISRHVPQTHRASPVLASKDTFYLACLLLERWLYVAEGDGGRKRRRLPETEQMLRDECMSLMHRTATHRCEPSYKSPLPSPMLDCLKMVSDQLYRNESSPLSRANIQFGRAEEALRRLEQHGLIVDPAFAGAEGAVVLLGLIPVRFSNRTGRGDRVFRELKIQAALWDLTYESHQATRGKKYERNWSVNIRGVRFIRGLLTDMAKRFLDSEAVDKQNHDEPMMEPPRNIEFQDPEPESNESS
ncbi:MAG: hypothetical protein AAGJ40_24205 [Planctomycetota bacterium]